MAIRNEVKDMLRANVALIESRFPVSNQIQGSFGARIAQAAAGRRASKTASQQRRGRRVNSQRS
jgi:hypothetical protein